MNVRFATLVCLLTLICAFALAQQTPQDTVIQNTREWLKSISQGDRIVLNRIMDERFIATTPAGDVLTKERFVPGDETQAVQQLPAMDLDGPLVRVYGDTAVLMSRLRPVGNEKSLNSTFIFRKQDNSWKLVALHLSILR
jgi:hypothetical protein